MAIMFLDYFRVIAESIKINRVIEILLHLAHVVKVDILRERYGMNVLMDEVR